MKHLLRKMIPAVLLGVALSSPAFAQGRVATVDYSKLFDGYWKTKQARATLNDRQAELTKEGNTLVDDLKKTNDEYQKLLMEANDQALSAEKRDERKKAAESKLREIEDGKETVLQFRRRAEQTVQDLFARTRQNLLTEIRTAVTAKAKSSGFALVLDTAAEGAQGAPVVMFSNGENDLTDAVLAQLNTGAPPETSPPADLKEEKKDGKK